MEDVRAKKLAGFHYFKKFLNEVIVAGHHKEHWKSPDYKTVGDLYKLILKMVKNKPLKVS